MHICMHTHAQYILGYQVQLITALHLYPMPDLSFGAFVPSYPYVTQSSNFTLPHPEVVLLQLRTQKESDVFFFNL